MEQSNDHPMEMRASQVASTSTSASRALRHSKKCDATRLLDCPKAIMSASLGSHATAHNLDHKLAALVESGYDGIEIHMDCLRNEARRACRLSESSAPSKEQLLIGARHVKEKCDAASIEILCLEPFLHYPGLPLNKRKERLEEVPFWFTLADTLGTDMIQIAGAMFGGEGVTIDQTRVVEDLAILADMGLQWRRTKYWAYEAMCFGHGTTTWEEAFQQVQLVDRANFGMVFDTFQILGAAYADPTAVDGKQKGADAAVESTLSRIRETFGGPANACNREKIFFVQLGDAGMPETPLTTEHALYDTESHANLKMTWGRNYRLFPGEGYLPTYCIAATLFVDCGWRGWISAEVMNRESSIDDIRYPANAARRCKKGHDCFLGRMSLSPNV